MTKLKILLVDDEKGFANIIAKRMVKRGLDVTKAYSGAEALQAIRKADFDVAVLDLKMEDMDGIEILRTIKQETNLLLETEILSTDHLDDLSKEVDLLRVGSRNMDNYELLKAVGRTNKPVILKRNMSATLEEFLLAAEYILSVGNNKVILCERGIRTFENYTRNTLDILAVPALKELTHLPVIVDPSHGIGIREMVPQMALAGIAAGADGTIIEVHHEPDTAFSDGAQTITHQTMKELLSKIKAIAPILGRKLN